MVPLVVTEGGRGEDLVDAGKVRPIDTALCDQLERLLEPGDLAWAGNLFEKVLLRRTTSTTL